MISSENASCHSNGRFLAAAEVTKPNAFNYPDYTSCPVHFSHVEFFINVSCCGTSAPVSIPVGIYVVLHSDS